jgi:hypothetical protein
MVFDIRAELPGSQLVDFRVNAEPRDNANGTKTPAFHIARERAEEKIRETRDVRSFQWRGMVLFVDRNVPLDPTRYTGK